MQPTHSPRATHYKELVGGDAKAVTGVPFSVARAGRSRGRTWAWAMCQGRCFWGAVPVIPGVVVSGLWL